MKTLYLIPLFVSASLYTATLAAQPRSSQPPSTSQNSQPPTGYTYDKEKIYIQTDHVFYTPGETIFFKTWLVRGSDNKPSVLSKIVYIEIMGPSGAILEKQTYPVENGYSEGSYTLDQQTAGGICKIKAYTS